MFNCLKIFAVLFLILGFLGLAGCEEKVPQYSGFLGLIKEDYENGLSAKDIVQKIFLEEYIEIPDPTDAILEKYDFDEIDRAQEMYEIWVLMLVGGIEIRDCEIVRSLQTERPPVTWHGEKRLEAIFYQDGICVEKDPAKAATIYQSIIDEGVRDSNAAARLGSLYLKGEGVFQDAEKADNLFQKAVMWKGPLFFGRNKYDSFFDDTSTIEYKIWGMTVRQMKMGFANIETGPWELPVPLMEKIHWLKGLEEKSGVKIIEIAKQMISGEGSYEKDIETALGWVASAFDKFENLDAAYLGARWLMDENICLERKTNNQFIDCDWEKSHGLSVMESNAFDGNGPAISFLVDYFSENQNGSWHDWSFYQYVLLAEKYGIRIDSNKRRESKLNLDDFKQEIVEAWIKDDPVLPITFYFPETEDVNTAN